jgi:hypothetical protein
MTLEELARIEMLIPDYRQRVASLKTADIVALAEALERTRRPGGIHLMYRSPLPGRRVLAITGHPSKAIGRGLALKMIRVLEDDIDAWRDDLRRRERGEQ